MSEELQRAPGKITYQKPFVLSSASQSSSLSRSCEVWGTLMEAADNVLLLYKSRKGIAILIAFVNPMLCSDEKIHIK